MIRVHYASLINTLEEETDAAAIKEAAHALKSMSTNIGAAKLGEVCQTIETQAGAYDLAGTKRTRVELESMFSLVIEHLKSESENIQANSEKVMENNVMNA